MPTTTMTVKTTGAPLMKPFVDHTPLGMTGGVGSVALSPGEYVLSWVVLGAPGDAYSIEITSPPSVVWKTSATLDSSGKDAGIHWVEI